jgi:hypothetical protein
VLKLCVYLLSKSSKNVSTCWIRWWTWSLLLESYSAATKFSCKTARTRFCICFESKHINAFVENISTAFYILKKDKFHGSCVKKFVVQKSFGNQKINNVEMIDNTRNQSQLEKSLSNLHSHMLFWFLFKHHSIFPRQHFLSFPVSNFPLLMDQCCRYIHIITGP